jgi:hypothetical protein
MLNRKGKALSALVLCAVMGIILIRITPKNNKTPRENEIVQIDSDLYCQVRKGEESRWVVCRDLIRGRVRDGLFD